MDYKEIYFEEIDSTNKYIKNHYLDLDNFTFITTSYQTEGKGRNERTWKSNKGENLLFSLLIKDKNLTELAGYLSLVTSVSVAQVIERYDINNVSIKWPNDINVNDKKVCGILLEGQVPDYLAIGIGINVNQKVFDGEYHISPTSLALEREKNIDLNDFKSDLLENLIYNISNINYLKQAFINYFNSHNYLKNKAIYFTYNNQELTGNVLGVSDDFSLLIDSNNQIMKVNSGEIHIKEVK